MIGGKHPKGFSLFEAVVVLSVFSIAILLVVTIFTNASDSQRRQAISQKALGDARLIINTLSQEISTQRIDYDFYKGNDFFGVDDASCVTFFNQPADECNLQSGVHVLALESNQGEQTRYWFDETNNRLLVCKNNPLVSPRNCKYNSGNYIDITPESVSFSGVTFWINPVSDPGYRGTPLTCSAATTCECVTENGAGRQEADTSLSCIGGGDQGTVCVSGTDCDSGVCSVGCGEWTSGYCDGATNRCKIPDAQPTVTTTIEIEGEGLSVGTVRVPIQFTSTSRIYDR
jgi:type II secretory pathway pseudopilin PulG